MTNHEAEKMFSDILLAWSFNKEPPAIEQSVWMKTLKKMDRDIARAAFEKRYQEQGQVKYFSLQKLLPVFRAAYYSLVPQKTKGHPWCPCCGGTGWIILEDANRKEVAHACHCRAGGEKNYQICKNKHCRNPKYSQKILVLAGYCEKYPWEVAGWKRCKCNPVISEVKNLGISPDNIALQLLAKHNMSIDQYIMPKGKDFKLAAAGEKDNQCP